MTPSIPTSWGVGYHTSRAALRGLVRKVGPGVVRSCSRSVPTYSRPGMKMRPPSNFSLREMPLLPRTTRSIGAAARVVLGLEVNVVLDDITVVVVVDGGWRTVGQSNGR